VHFYIGQDVFNGFLKESVIIIIILKKKQAFVSTVKNVILFPALKCGQIPWIYRHSIEFSLIKIQNYYEVVIVKVGLVVGHYFIFKNGDIFE
jgi:hypothetical protein